MSCFQAFDDLCRRIVCPTRHLLNEQQMIQRKFKSNKIKYEQFAVTNAQNLALSVIAFHKSFETLPTVLYLHGNGGHKLECLQLANSDFNLISFDFSGCGKSQGDYVTYGEREVEDIALVVADIKKRYGVKKLAIWGRSMGASLALMYSSLKPSDIFALVLDTPFRCLEQVVLNVAEHNKRSVPNFLLQLAVYFVERKVKSIVNTDVFENDFLMHLNLIKEIPILFAYSSNDTVVREENVKELFDAYKGSKLLCHFDALHHQDRPKSFVQEAVQFIIGEEERSSRTSITTGYLGKGICLSTRAKW